MFHIIITMLLKKYPNYQTALRNPLTSKVSCAQVKENTNHAPAIRSAVAAAAAAAAANCLVDGRAAVGGNAISKSN
jgi:hypothetical protein